MSKTIPAVDGYVRKHKQWQDELQALRAIALECGLTEAVKWRAPCYTFAGGNVLIVNALKAYCALGFFKGALLKDAKGILVKPGENSRAARLVRFTAAQDIAAMKPVLKAYIAEAIEVEKAGLKVDLKADAELPVPPELARKLAEHPALKTAFAALTPGRQRGYILHFSAPKQSKTRDARIEKCVPQILQGKGMHDDYRATRR